MIVKALCPPRDPARDRVGKDWPKLRDLTQAVMHFDNVIDNFEFTVSCARCEFLYVLRGPKLKPGEKLRQRPVYFTEWGGPAPEEAICMLVFLDPALTMGWATTSVAGSGAIDLRPTKAKKGKPALAEKKTRKGIVTRPARPSIPPQDAEPDEVKIFKLWDHLARLHSPACGGGGIDALGHEAPLAHHAGARAAQIAWECRTTIVLFCRQHEIPRYELKPFDLQRHALGRASVPKSNDMLDAARAFLGYAGAEHNEADALWGLDWLKKQVAR